MAQLELMPLDRLFFRQWQRRASIYLACFTRSVGRNLNLPFDDNQGKMEQF